MRRTALIKKLRSIAKANGHEFVEEREGASHSIFSINGQNISIPRHREINENTARSIIKEGEAASE